ncbi:MAG TPA: NAD-dependent epimerase/dehydratase family protein [Candidatus Heimdallarchaeota archaeon]|nr:NAD-dependent epimerase/dehydratase family protein [Candidatus Heimdallarchaeota archaeon]
MRVLIIGGTRRCGPYLVEQLIDKGHSVVCFHRGQHNVVFSERAEEILGDRRDVSLFKERMKTVEVDAVVDMMAGDDGDVHALGEVFAGRIKRYVCISSYEVYEAFEAAWNRTVSSQPVPIPEDAPKRKQVDLYGHERRYDKVLMEKAVFEAHARGDFDVTILRWPALYGPRDTTPREWYYVKQALDGRRRIPVANGGLSLFSRGYLENMAHTVVLALENDVASGQVYNAADAHAMTPRQIIAMIGEIIEHEWEIVSIPRQLMPAFSQSQGRPFSPDPYDIEPHVLMDLAKIKGELGYRDLVPLRTAMERTVEWLCEHRPEGSAPFDYRALDAVLDTYTHFLSEAVP